MPQVSNSARFLPAEWAEQSAIMLTWPHRGTDWHDMLDEVEAVYFQIAHSILRNQALLISCEDPERLSAINSQLRPIADEHHQALRCYQIPADDTWARDHGPISVLENGQPLLLDFKFNAWGDKFASSKDNQISRNLAQQGAFANTRMEAIDFILEGGSIESDGHGSVLTTEHCLLTDSRNSQLLKDEIVTKLKQHLGAEQILWLSEGFLIGDDTDAHIDTLARFCPNNTICYVRCQDPEDEHFAPLSQMEQQLRSLKNTAGQPYALKPLPLPKAIYFGGRRLSATYANFLITNHSVLLPIYGVEEDQAAQDIIAKCFPDREVVPINCLPLIKQNGSLHCITMQISKGISI